ncbi:metal ABC transporter substrate-binding protein [Marinilactibacillus sp. 15R]|uniref:MetQ/NlpA family ABC transporter substrate-binding protein n=1 Tax=Marinilactibacillus sp. 15R TaxID=1911586 RepID=UPI00090AA88E|nr:MetQ/NlpA family ABC transporter substrate-binding protein [Marinilactibacillus sp. 15R]API88036.1 metal ABC transporter substrate-binding protein [Marinilactibacillus sp. 15R]
MSKKWGVLATIATGVILTGCGAGQSDSAESEDLLSDGVLTVGVTAGPHEDIVNEVKKIAAEDGLEIEVVSFTDFVKPNTALAEGDLDINSFQTGIFLDTVVEDSGYDLTKIEPTVTIPMGIYSEKYSDISEIKDGDVIGIPNSPTQEGRALQLFEDAGLITLPEGSSIEVTTSDIEENPLNLDFVTTEAAQLPAQLQDVGAAGINSNFVLDAGMNPAETSLFMEDVDDLFQVNYIVSRTENKDDEALAQFVEYYKTPEIKQFIEEEFKGALVPSW